MVTKAFAEWLDIGSGFLRSANYVSTVANLPSYLAAAQGASNASLAIATHGPADTSVAVPAVDAAYPSSLDTAVLVFSTGLSLVRVTIPAPKSMLFTSSQETVDPTDPTGLLAAAIASLGDTLGNPVVSFVQGVRASRRKDVE